MPRSSDVPVSDLSSASVGQLFIPVANLEDSISFYRDALGLPFLFTAPPQMAFFQAGDVRLLVGVPDAEHRQQRSATVYFKVSDIQAVFTTLSERGVAFREEPRLVHRAPGYELWLCVFADPDGNSMALMSEQAVPPAAD